MNSWDSINKLGKNKLLATSYVWLIVVPLFAKILSLIENPLDFSAYIPGLIINFSLPFSWQLFYFSAVIISLAGAIYYFACPSIIKSFSTYAEFQSEGRDASYLEKYAERLDGFSFEGHAKDAIYEPAIEPERQRQFWPQAFWQIYEYEKGKYPTVRVICFILYVVGIALIVIILADNFRFVINQLGWL